MAYISPLINEEEKKNQQGLGLVGTQTSSGQTSVIDGGSSSAGSNPSGAQVSATAPQQTKGGGSGWTNIQNYKQANLDNDQPMAEAINETQSREKGQLANAFSTLKSDLSSGIENARLKGFDQMFERVKGTPGKVSQDDFSKYYNYQYGGPQSVENVGSYQSAEDEYNDLTNVSNKTKNYRGVADLLNETYGKDANYNRGQNLLDAFITRSGDKGQASLENMRQGLAGAQTAYTQGKQGLGSTIADAQRQADDERYNFRGQTNQLYDKWLGDIQGIKSQAGKALSRGFIGTTGEPQKWITGQDKLNQYADQGSDMNARLSALSGLLGTNYEQIDFANMRDQLLAQEQQALDDEVAKYMEDLAKQQAETQAIAKAAADEEAAKRTMYDMTPRNNKNESSDRLKAILDPTRDVVLEEMGDEYRGGWQTLGNASRDMSTLDKIESAGNTVDQVSKKTDPVRRILGWG